MGFECNFVAVSKNHEQLRNLKEYIHELYERDYERDYVDDYDHRMLGYGMRLEQVDNWFFLTGYHRKCYGFDLGYWCNKEGRNNLLDGVYYLENREDDNCILLYNAGPIDEPNGMLSDVDEIMTEFGEDVPSAECKFPTELVWTVRRCLINGSAEVM